MATTTTAEQATARLELALGHWQAMRKLQLDFIEKLGQYKLATAQAELARAVAASQWAVARMKARVARELEQALGGVQRLRGQTRRKVRRLERYARDAAKIRSGESLAADQLPHVWAAYTVFERAVPAAVLEQLANTPLAVESRQGRSYADVRRPDVVCPDPPASVTNVHMLLHWLRRHGFLPRRGTEAYRQVIEAFFRFATVAETQVTALQAALQQLEQRTFETWQPLVLAALPDSVDVKKIVTAKLR